MGTERSRHIPFAPFTGRRCRQADEGRTGLCRRTIPALRLRFGRSPLQSIHWIDCSGFAGSWLTLHSRFCRGPSPCRGPAPCG
ncbi:hypothetical protein EOS93_31360 [Rhizobium sp. RMa-01]|nr:hypothetical protein EOS93_31360 [Rhizobium sp. RMa-01]